VQIKGEKLPCILILYDKKKVPVQALRGPEGSRRLRLPHFMAIGT